MMNRKCFGKDRALRRPQTHLVRMENLITPTLYTFMTVSHAILYQVLHSILHNPDRDTCYIDFFNFGFMFHLMNSDNNQFDGADGSLYEKKKVFILSVCCLILLVSFTYISGPSDFLLGFYNPDQPHNLPLAFKAERVLLTRTTASVFCHAIIAVSDFLEFSCTLSYFSVSDFKHFHAVCLRTNKVFFNL